MIDIIKEGAITTFIPELAQLITYEILVLDARTFEFEFMDGSRCKVTI
jgi:hypothetical protein